MMATVVCECVCLAFTCKRGMECGWDEDAIDGKCSACGKILCSGCHVAAPQQLRDKYPGSAIFCSDCCKEWE